MSKPRHIVKPTLQSLIGSSLALGVAASLSCALAGDLSSMGHLANRGLLQAQTAENPQKQAPAQAVDTQQATDEVPFSELNEALSAARARLAELTKAAEIAKVAGDLKEELKATKAQNQQMSSELQKARSELAQLRQAEQAASQRAEQSELAAAGAETEARRLDEELVAMRWQNSQLSTGLSEAETAARSLSEELETVRSELGARIESLSATSDESAAEIQGLRKEVDATRESALIAEQRGAELEQQLARRSLEADEARAEAAKFATDLDRTITELSNVRAELSSTTQALDEATVALSAASQETVALREQVAGSREEADQLRAQFDASRAEIEQISVRNTDLQQQVGVLRTAAGEATDAARLNLIAVENQINEINAALASVKGDEEIAPSGDPTVAVNGATFGNDLADAGTGDVAAIEIAGTAQDVWIPTLTPARPEESGQRTIASVAASPANAAELNPPQSVNSQAAGNPLANRVGQVEAGDDAFDVQGSGSAEEETLVAALTDERRERAETLVAELNIKEENLGLTMTVPGAILFAVNSDTIEQDAYGMLTKVAEMIELYQDRQVLIVGHTDAVGDDSYNQQLSERRAALVKDHFVEELGIEIARLASEGQGETRPIKSNATAEGRDANRRVEVIILN